MLSYKTNSYIRYYKTRDFPELPVREASGSNLGPEITHSDCHSEIFLSSPNHIPEYSRCWKCSAHISGTHIKVLLKHVEVLQALSCGNIVVALNGLNDLKSQDYKMDRCCENKL